VKLSCYVWICQDGVFGFYSHFIYQTPGLGLLGHALYTAAGFIRGPSYSEDFKDVRVCVPVTRDQCLHSAETAVQMLTASITHAWNSSTSPKIEIPCPLCCKQTLVDTSLSLSLSFHAIWKLLFFSFFVYVSWKLFIFSTFLKK